MKLWKFSSNAITNGILYEVICSPLIFTFVLVAIVHLLYSTDFQLQKVFLKFFVWIFFN